MKNFISDWQKHSIWASYDRPFKVGSCCKEKQKCRCFFNYVR